MGNVYRFQCHLFWQFWDVMIDWCWLFMVGLLLVLHFFFLAIHERRLPLQASFMFCFAFPKLCFILHVSPCPHQ